MKKEETAPEMLQRLGMDGHKWAEEMHKSFPAIPVADLLGWCCNMIMAGYDEACCRARKEIKYVPMGELPEVRINDLQENIPVYITTPPGA